jgi:type III pantothenate kinase
MLLALDIGNTNITLGVFEGDELKATSRLATDARRMADEYGLMLSQLLPLRGISPSDVTAVALCSVVPPLTPTFVEMSESFLSITPLVVGMGTRTGIRIRYDTPRDVGSDRIVDAAAVFSLYGGPAIVVDFGTATVFDAISAKGEYLGGALAPGITVAADALFHSTSQLRRVELERPPAAIGTNTVHAMQSGLVLGYAEMVKGMVARFDEELGGGATVVGTGGLAEVIEREVKVFDAVDPNLTLTGLRIIHDLNDGKDSLKGAADS